MTQQETVDIVQGMFPALSSYPAERIKLQMLKDPDESRKFTPGWGIEFLVTITKPRPTKAFAPDSLEGSYPGHLDPEASGWRTVLEHDWEYFEERPPGVIRVVVAPLDQEALIRESYCVRFNQCDILRQAWHRIAETDMMDLVIFPRA